MAYLRKERTIALDIHVYQALQGRKILCRVSRARCILFGLFLTP